MMTTHSRFEILSGRQSSGVHPAPLRSANGLIGYIPAIAISADGTLAHVRVRLTFDGLGEIFIPLARPISAFQTRLNACRGDQPVRELRQWLEAEAYKEAIRQDPDRRSRRILETRVRWKNLRTGGDEPFLR